MQTAPRPAAPAAAYDAGWYAAVSDADGRPVTDRAAAARVVAAATGLPWAVADAATEAADAASSAAGCWLVPLPAADAADAADEGAEYRAAGAGAVSVAAAW